MAISHGRFASLERKGASNAEQARQPNDGQEDDCEEVTRHRVSKAHAPNYVVLQLARARPFR